MFLKTSSRFLGPNKMEYTLARSIQANQSLPPDLVHTFYTWIALGFGLIGLVPLLGFQLRGRPKAGGGRFYASISLTWKLVGDFILILSPAFVIGSILLEKSWIENYSRLEVVQEKRNFSITRG